MSALIGPITMDYVPPGLLLEGCHKAVLFRFLVTASALIQKWRIPLLESANPRLTNML